MTDTTKTYAQQVGTLGREMSALANTIANLEEVREAWTKPGKARLLLDNHYDVVLADGTVNPLLKETQVAFLKACDARLFTLRGRLEGLRFKLSRLGKTGGAS